MKVIVVGGGIAGLAAATRLVDGGHEVTLYERRPSLGGRAYSIVDETTSDVIDNGQHLFMGCYSSLRRFLGRIGATGKLRFQDDLQVAFRHPDGSTSRLRTAPLPAPFHLLGGLLGFATLSWRDRFAMAKVAAALTRPSALFPAASDFETVERWLDRIGQSREARRGFWHPLALATLNDDPRTASAKMLEAVLREAFFGTRDDARLGMARGGLSELYAEDAARFIEASGGRIVTGAHVESLELIDRVVRGIRLRDGSLLPADAVITAVPPPALLALVPEAARAGETYFEGLARLESSPIISVHLWLDRLVSDGELLGLIDRPVHWIFDRNQLAKVHAPTGSHLSLVISAARDLIDRPAQELVGLALAEVRRALPAAADAQLVHSRVMKERDATIAHTAGTEGFRPTPRSPFGGLFVAGDFVRTGLPATLESAVRSADSAVAELGEWTPPPARIRTNLVDVGRLVRGVVREGNGP